MSQIPSTSCPQQKTKLPPKKNHKEKLLETLGFPFHHHVTNSINFPLTPSAKLPKKYHKEKLWDSELGYNSKAVREPTNSSH